MDDGLNDESNYTTTNASTSDQSLPPSTLSKSDSNPEEDTENIDVTGPGPRPLDEVARENSGDAGQSSETASASTDQKSAGSAGDGPEDPSDSQEQGTGEQWVKTSGLAADGGDFDATKPGAGREADRTYFPHSIACQKLFPNASNKTNPYLGLMEQKGIKLGDGGKAQGDASHGQRSNSGSSDQSGLIDRLKDKLHKH